MSDIDYKRRQILIAGGITLGASLFPQLAIASPFRSTNPRQMSMCNIHTGEDLDTQYFDGEDYLPEELQRIYQICRDFRQNEVAKMDKKLFDGIAKIQANLGHKGQVRIISGYRSPKTNQLLQKNGGVAKKKLPHERASHRL